MKKRLRIIVSLLAVAGIIFGTALGQRASATVPGTNTLVSYNSTNTAPSSYIGNTYATLSDDGNFAVFYSHATDLVPSDTNGTWADIFIRDLKSSTTSLVDVSTSGVQGNYDADAPKFAVSRTGRYVAFSDSSTNLIDGQTLPSSPRLYHVYLRDTVLGTTTLVDQTSTGTLANKDWNPSSQPEQVTGVSDDGRFVLWSTTATNLLATGNPPGTNTTPYPYIKDMQTGSIRMVSMSSSGAIANAVPGNAYMSCDGSIIIFGSAATNLTASNNGHYSVYVADQRDGYSLANLTLSANADVGNYLAPSCNGRYIIVGGTATNLTSDVVNGTTGHIFSYDRLTGSYTLIDKSTSGTPSAGIQTSGYNGRLVSDTGSVVFISTDKTLSSPSAVNTIEIYLRTPIANTTEILPINISGSEQTPAASTYSKTLAITSDGKSVLYNSTGTNLIPGITTAPSGDGNIVLGKTQ